MLTGKRNIKKYKVYFSAIIFLSGLFFAFSKDDCPVVWDAARPLQREDFKGKRIHKGVVASTTYNIIKKISENRGRLKASVKACFYCYNSWILKDTLGNDVILHEQKHFDIAELYARKLRKQMMGSYFKNLREAEYKSDSLFDLINEEMDIFQDSYDNETDHSRNGFQQRRWNERIAIHLNELKDYSQPDFILNRNSLSHK